MLGSTDITFSDTGIGTWGHFGWHLRPLNYSASFLYYMILSSSLNNPIDGVYFPSNNFALKSILQSFLLKLYLIFFKV